MQKEVSDIVRDIKSLKIQGARNIAKSAVKGLIIEAKASKSNDMKSFFQSISLASAALAKARPTEPMTRNLMDESLRFIERKVKEKSPLDSVRTDFLFHEKNMLKGLDKDAERLAEYGAELIPDNGLIITHCHSSTATAVLRKAKSMKKQFSVIACETRPRFQGRKTAQELAEAGIDVTLVVDGAANLFMKKADMCLVGADSITSRGDLINKVGTSMLAHIAKSHDVSFYCAAELLKFSPHTMYGVREKIEERDPKEVWDKPPKKVKVRNPAFDVTASSYISGFVSEAGVIPAQSFFSLAAKKIGIRMEG